MKSAEKPLGNLRTSSERMSASPERSPAGETPLTAAPQNPASGTAGFREADAPGETGKPVAAPSSGMADASKKDAPAAADVTDVDVDRVDPHLVCLLEPRSEQAETYYRLRHQLESRRGSDTALVVAVTSAGPGDGKSLTAINLAGARARGQGARVLLLDLNLRRAGEGVADYLGMKASKDEGIVDWAHGEEKDFATITHYLEPFNLHVVTAGSNPEHPYELLKSPRLDELLQQVRQDYDFVIVDTPQILGLPDTELISRIVDGFLIVVKAGHTRQARLEEALNLMTEEQVIGLVFNAVPRIA